MIIYSASGYSKPNPRAAAFERKRAELRPCVVQMVADGLSPTEVARRLNEQGYRGPLGGRFDATSVRRLIKGYHG